jgi:hypothetical protein
MTKPTEALNAVSVTGAEKAENSTAAAASRSPSMGHVGAAPKPFSWAQLVKKDEPEPEPEPPSAPAVVAGSADAAAADAPQEGWDSGAAGGLKTHDTED